MGLPDTPVWRHVEAIRMIMTMTTSEIDQAAATYLRDEPSTVQSRTRFRDVHAYVFSDCGLRSASAAATMDGARHPNAQSVEEIVNEFRFRYLCGPSHRR